MILGDGDDHIAEYTQMLMMIAGQTDYDDDCITYVPIAFAATVLGSIGWVPKAQSQKSNCTGTKRMTYHKSTQYTVYIKVVKCIPSPFI